MNKFFITILLALTGISCNAQIYTHIIQLDKFDDVVKSEEHKTLVTMNDSTFVIEEKGKLPVEYRIIFPISDLTKGSKESPANLVDDVFGYQESWLVIRNDMLDKCKDALQNMINDPSYANREAFGQFTLAVVHRTITDEYVGNYRGEAFWIEDSFDNDVLGKDVRRIIYTKE